MANRRIVVASVCVWVKAEERVFTFGRILLWITAIGRRCEGKSGGAARETDEQNQTGSFHEFNPLKPVCARPEKSLLPLRKGDFRQKR
jgi:hypothetical protein